MKPKTFRSLSGKEMERDSKRLCICEQQSLMAPQRESERGSPRAEERMLKD